ncbi:MAG: hypothetical protein JWM11_1282 [Planctomycetaceae bacterium]|nr:hypothetical protein [Planctomycetaceae bacterium]
MIKPEDLIAAGAYLSAKEKLKNESTVDNISARLYRHAALGNRPIVRLIADNLAEGEDLTMEFLGCTPPEVTGPIAKRQRQALGFPGWAVVNDPPHARYALELVKEFKKAVRRSKAKPGFGYEEFTEISKRLGKSVAHFLPSFWEQAGREFIALDNATYGSRAFGKAREAEKVHALKVDESLRQDAFLEFALAGAVSIKALTEYGKELLSTHDPKAAWKFFRELCVRRTLGGMPPWTSMLKDLQPLMKATGLNQDEEIRSVLLEIIDSPAISRASMGFWVSASKAISQLVVQNNHVAGVLLNMIPQTSSWRNDDLWPWLDHLDSWGILANAWKDNVADEAQPNGGPAAWLTRLTRNYDRPRQKIFDILEAMAPRLRKDNVPVDLYSKNRWNHIVSADVDLIDLALELKVPFLEVPAGIFFDLKHWAVPVDLADKLRNRPRDPVHVVADGRFTQSIHNALQAAAGESAFEAVAAGKIALRDARRKWLSSLVGDLTSGGLPGAESSLQLLENKTRRAIFEEFPEALEQLKGANIQPAIERTICGGLMDEYGWPALERVFENFIAANKSPPLVFGQFPYVILTDRLKAVVLKGEDIVHETELKLPKGHELKCLRFIDGDLLVWSGKGYQFASFWNSDPHPGEPEYVHFASELSGISVDVPGGGTFIGDKIVHRGSQGLTGLRDNDSVICDGTHWWMRSFDYNSVTTDHEYSIHEIDPVTGKKGRKSMPSFFEDFVRDNSQLDIAHSSLLPVGDSFPNSPLGVHAGLAGFRIRSSPNGTRRIEGVDGRAWESTSGREVSFLLKQPATETLLPLEQIKLHSASKSFTIWDPSGAYEISAVAGDGDSYSRGQVTGVSPIYLHEFQIRDLAASKKLRSISDAEVGALLQAEQQDFDNFTSGNVADLEANAPANTPKKTPVTKIMQKLTLRDEALHSPLLDDAIRKLLGKEVHTRLLTGLRGITIRAGQKIRQLAKLVETRSAEPVADKSAVDVAAADAAATPYLASIKYGFRSLPHLSFMESAGLAAKFFTGQSAGVLFPQQWLDHLRTLTKGVAQRIWSAYCSDPKDGRWIPFAEGWSQLAFHQLPGSFRIFIAATSDNQFLDAEKAVVKAEAAEAGHVAYLDWGIPYIGKRNRFLIDRNYRGFEVIEYSADGEFESISGLTEQPGSEVIIPPPVWSADALRSFIGLAKLNPVNIPPAALLKSLAEEVKASVAEVALVWFGLPGFDDYSVNFMPTPLREGCKLKTKECSAAKEALKALPANLLQSLVRAVIAGEPADLWEQPPTKVADRIRAAWHGEKPNRLPLSAEWMEKLSESIGYGVNKNQLFEALNTPLTHPLLSDQGVWKFGKVQNWTEPVCHDDRFKFNESVLQAVGNCIALLAYGLPVGDPARTKIVEVYQATLKALANPGLLLSAGGRYDSGTGKGPKLSELLESIVGKPQKQDSIDVADDGCVVVGVDENRLRITFRPARATTHTEIERVSNQLNALLGTADQESLEPSSVMKHFRVVRSDDFQALVNRIKQTPVPPGNYETNPLHSAPDIVKQVTRKLALSEDAAVYYLQLITLADPTDKNVTLWNGWTTASIKKHGSELLEKKLVLEASRTRAGRKHFLPGGWEDLKAPHLPLETWKIPHFQLSRDYLQRPVPPFGRIVPLEPVHALFAKAWKRIVDGDVPRYEEVK